MAYIEKYCISNSLGDIFISDKVFKSIILDELEDMEGLKKASANIVNLGDQVRVNNSGDVTNITINLKARYGLSIPDVVAELHKKTIDKIKELLGEIAVIINVNVRDLYFE